MAKITLVPLEKLISSNELRVKSSDVIEINGSSGEDSPLRTKEKHIERKEENKEFCIMLTKLPSVNSIIRTYNLDEIRDQRNNVIASNDLNFHYDERQDSLNTLHEFSNNDSDFDTDLKKIVHKTIKKKVLTSASEDEGPLTKKLKKDNSSNELDGLLDSQEDVDLRSAMKQKKKMKRIVQNDDSSDDEKSTKETKRRKNIRQFKGNDSLDENTKKAAKEEKLRLERLAERQRLYNSFCDENDQQTSDYSKSSKLILDFDQNTKKVLLEVDQGIVSNLKPHQLNGIKFMWEACFESLNRIETNEGSGCILAHCMGLGKTLQVVALVHAVLAHSAVTKVKHVLVVSPLSTVLNWVNEFDVWCSKAESNYELNLYELSKTKQHIERAYRLKEWCRDGGVLIIGYEMFRNLTNIGTKLRKKLREDVMRALLDPGPDLVICDEGHLLKNEKTSLSKAMNRIRTLRRIVLTGTPLQNNLKEYYCMVQFVKPNLLGSYKEYLNRFVNPITNGQYCDSTDLDIKVMRRRSHVLHKMLEGSVQRRDYSVLSPFLPKKHEYVVFIKLSDLQIKLYKFYMEHRPALDASKKAATIFQDFQNLQRIWTHPRVLRYNSDKYEKVMAKKELEVSDSEGSIRDFIADSDEESEAIKSTTSNSDEENDEKTKRVIRTRTKAAEMEDDDIIELSEEKRENPTEWWMQMVSNDDLDKIDHSAKLIVLFSILQMCEEIGDKLLIFSQSLYSLDVIEHFLRQIDDTTQATDSPSKLKYSASWALGLDYFRLDGSTSVENRSQFCSSFNDETNTRARLFLISTRAGGLGINLVAANRVIIFDVSWNPSHDIQSIFRIYRFGQKKPCYVYRFVALGTMEEKIYERQVTKEAISKRVIDEQQIDRHYKEKDILELYMTDLEPEKPKETPLLPKDRLFADVLTNHPEWIYKYHEHDSLLENKEEETLDEEERKAAWDDYNSEKERKLQITSFGSYTGHGQKGFNGEPAASSQIFGIQSNVMLMLLQLKIKRDYPYYSQLQVSQSVPLLMQELYRQMANGEITLYQEILELRNSMINSAQAPGPSSTYQPAGYATPNQVTQYQQNWMYKNRSHDPNEVVEID